MSPDGKEWTFVIRDDATWHDGTPVTAADVVYTVEALKSPDAAGALSAAWAEVTVDRARRAHRAVHARDADRRLPRRGDPAAPAGAPARATCRSRSSRTATSPRLPVGTGPYALTEIDERRAVLLPASVVEPSPEPSEPRCRRSRPTRSRRPLPQASPVGPAPYLDRIEILFYPDDAAVTDALHVRCDRRGRGPRPRTRRASRPRRRASTACATRRRPCPRSSSTCARATRSCATRRARGAPRRPRPRGARGHGAGRRGRPGLRARPAVLVGVRRDRRGAGACTTRHGRRSCSRTPAGRRSTARGPRPARRSPTSWSCWGSRRRRTRGSRRSPSSCATPGPSSGSR